MSNFLRSQKVSVLGGGAWGCALANHFAKREMLHRLYTHYPETITAINQNHLAPKLKDVPLSPSLIATDNLGETMQANVILIACNVDSLKRTLSEIKDFYQPHQQLILGAKGIFSDTRLPHQVAQEILPNAFPMLLSGPSFAVDLASQRMVAVILAGDKHEQVTQTAKLLSAPNFRLYTSLDMNGVALCGALKNIIAIGAGICRGINVGNSAEAALITRGLSEMGRLSLAENGKGETTQGLAGLGDLLMTCASENSRNMRFGLALAKGMTVAEALNDVGATVEGYHTTKIILELAKKHKVELPIMSTMYRILYDGLSINQAIESLLYRPSAKSEL